MKKPALLSPAGDMECLKAAVYAGADEVYFGLEGFNARKNAKNFTLEEACDAIKFCRIYNVKTNITLNTLLYEREFPDAIELVSKLEEAMPPDAYIIQDLGLAYRLKKTFPDIELHASTQMQIHGSYSVPLLKQLGFKRAVIAREMDSDEIRAFASSGIETEVFIHGAMCVCRSGGCLMSSMIGKRSGNRGECAYPCRMTYNNGYPLSLKDMCLASHIPELISMGVDALKIEGRMKSPEYVYGVTEIYRRLLDENRSAGGEDITRLTSLFSRSGFTDGYFTGKLGRNMFGIRTESDKEKTREEEKFTINEKKLPVELVFESNPKEKMSLTLRFGSTEVKSYGEIPDKATSREASADEISKQITKLGQTRFFAKKTDVIFDKNAFYPVSALNELRRNAVNLLEKAIIDSNSPQKDKKFKFVDSTLPTQENQNKKTVRLRFEGNFVSEKLCEEADFITVPIWKPNLWKNLADRFAPKISVMLPGFIFDKDVQNIRSLLLDAKSFGIKRVTLPNASFIPLCDGFILDGGYELNCISKTTAEQLLKLGFSTVCGSPECKNFNWQSCEAIVYGRVKLMNTKNCIIRNFSKCTNMNGGTLTDRTDTVFPVFCDYKHTNSIYNSVPIWLMDKNTDSSHLLIFTTETAAEQEKIFEKYKNNSSPNIKFTRAYF